MLGFVLVIYFIFLVEKSVAKQDTKIPFIEKFPF